MTEKNYITQLTRNHKIDHTTFGGMIYKEDIDGYHSMSNATSRIISDLEFDKQCKKNIENKIKQKHCAKGNN